MKKLLSIILTVILMISICPLGMFSFTATAETDGLYTYTVSNGEAIITNVDENISGDVTIPSTLGGYPVTSIGMWAFEGCTGLTSITIPDSVTSIGNSAFSGCSSIEEITLPFVGDKRHTPTDTYQYPLGYIFGNTSYTGGTATAQYYYRGGKINITYCIPTSLKKVTITDSEYIPYGALYNCSNLTSIEIPDSVKSIASDAFSGCNKLNYNIYDNAKYLGNGQNPYVVLFAAADQTITSCEINSKTRIIMDSAFFGCTGLISITIPDLVTSIGNYAFYGCHGLTSVTIPDSVRSIGGAAFYKCTGLKNITIPDSVKSIASNAFSGCTALEYNSVGKGKYLGNEQNPYFALISVDLSAFNDSFEIPSGVKLISGSAFSNCTMLASVTIPDSVTSIGEYAFRGCTGLTSITIPNSVTSIDSYTFYGCTGLTSVTIPDSVTSIGDSAFSGCSGLKSITIGKSVTSIGRSAFYNCSALAKVNYTGTIADWCNISFGDYDLNPLYYAHNFYINDEPITDLVIPDTVTKINDYAFYNCRALKSIAIPDSVISIGRSAFYKCTRLTNLTIGNSVTSIGGSAFSGCSGLTSVTIPDSVTSIGSSAFAGCSSLQEITLPFVGDKRHTSSDTYQYPFGYIFGTSSYSGGTATTQYYYGSSTSSTTNSKYYIPSTLKKVTITDSEYIPYGAFYNCSNLTTITISDSVKSIASNAFSGCTALEYNSLGKGKYLGNEQNPYFALISVDLSVFNDSFEIPSGVKLISGSAFSNCTMLTSVTIPDSVTSIGDSAFSGCSGLKSITIGKSVTSIGSSAFYNCSALAKVNYTGTIADWCNISFVNFDSNPLYYAKKLYINDNLITDIVIPDTVAKINQYVFNNCTGLKSVTIGKSVTSIGESAFEGCTGLTSITIPNSVTWIGEYAFYGCKGLTRVNYTGTVADWCNISFGYGSNPINYAHNIYINGELITDLVIPDSVKEIKNYAFEECTTLKSVTIPDSVKSIGNNAFYWCTGLTNLRIGNSVEAIGDYAFYSCKKLNNFTIPDSVITIGEYAFYCCTGLTGITIPDLVTSIGEGAFVGCTGLKSVTIGNSVTSIGWSAFFDCKGLTKVTIPDSVTSIGGDVFSGCSSLQEITLPFVGDKRHTSSDTYQYPFGYIFGTTSYTGGTATTQRYYGSSLSGTTSGTYYIPSMLKKVTITDSEYIPSCAFYNCARLTSVTIGDSAKKIGGAAFSGCTGLTSLTIPDSVTSIDYSAFYNCTGLTSITIGNSVTSIGDNAFSDCSALAKVNYTGTIADWCNISFSSDNSNPLGYAHNFYINDKLITNLVIPEPVTKINDYAFYNCTGLTSVTILGSVTSIGDEAFSGCEGLASITIPKTVSTIGYSAFEGCTGLKDIWYGGSYDDRDNIAVGTNNAPIISATWHFNTCKDGEHIFDSACDTTCNNCEWTRETTHTVVIDNAVASTCTETGLTEGKHCSVCGTVLVAQSVVPALGHSYKAVVTNPTCTAQGYTTHTCSRCKDSYVDTYVDALGHDYKAVVTKPTCTERGYTTYTCSRCQDSYVDTYKPALGHTEVIDKAADPTCTATGLTEGKHCSVCNTVLTAQTVVPALGHTMVNGKCSVCGYQAQKVNFPDVSYSAWYGNAVNYAVTAGLMKGYGSGKFGTADGIQRQDFVVILSRLSGDDLSKYEGKTSFKDVSKGAYYAAALAWAKAKGVSSGYANGKFGVGDKVTREQIMVFLYNYAKLKGYDTTATMTEAQAKATYADFGKVSGYAKEAALWALSKGVVSGKDAGGGKKLIAPQANALRCEVAAMFYNIEQKDIFKK